MGCAESGVRMLRGKGKDLGYVHSQTSVNPGTSEADESAVVDGSPAGPGGSAPALAVCAIPVVWEAQQLSQFLQILLVHFHRHSLGFTSIPAHRKSSGNCTRDLPMG